ncbi:MAG: hypothetical protein ACREBS_10445 [Nitrososphaerales archaeon]
MSEKQKVAIAKVGWKKMPSCPFLVVDADRNFYCAYDFENELHEQSKLLADSQLEDIGFDQGYDDAFQAGLIRRRCSFAECPKLTRRQERATFRRLHPKR